LWRRDVTGERRGGAQSHLQEAAGDRGARSWSPVL
jgi:hypothetical protein